MCENNNKIEVDDELIDLSSNLQSVFTKLDASANKACMTQMQQKRFDLDIIDAEAIRVSKFSSELLAYSLKIRDILKKLSATRNLWIKLNGITDTQAKELEKKAKESCEKAEDTLKEHLKEIF